jgi:hypothetical protein
VATGWGWQWTPPELLVNTTMGGSSISLLDPEREKCGVFCTQRKRWLSYMAKHLFYSVALSIWGCNHGSVVPPDHGARLMDLLHFAYPSFVTLFIFDSFLVSVFQETVA